MSEDRTLIWSSVIPVRFFGGNSVYFPRVFRVVVVVVLLGPIAVRNTLDNIILHQHGVTIKGRSSQVPSPLRRRVQIADTGITSYHRVTEAAITARRLLFVITTARDLLQ